MKQKQKKRAKRKKSTFTKLYSLSFDMYKKLQNSPFIILTILVIVTLLVTHGRFIFGLQYFIFLDIGSDTINGYVPMYHAVVHKLSSGDFSFWSFHYGVGANILNLQSTVFDPFAFPVYVAGILFGSGAINYMVIVSYVIRVLCAVYLCYLYLSHFGFSRKAKIIASYLYGFNGFMMLWGQHYFFGTAVVMVVLILLCVERVLKNHRNFVALSVSVGVLLIYSYYIGYMVLLFTGVYTIIRVLQLTSTKEYKKGLFRLGVIGGSVSLGIGLSMVIFLPSFINLMFVGERVVIDDPLSNFLQVFSPTFIYGLSFYRSIILRFISNNFEGVGNYFMGHLNYYESAQLFFSSFFLIFLAVFAYDYFTQRKGFKSNVLFTLSILLCVHWVLIPGFDFLLEVFNGVRHRTTFMLMPLFAVVVAGFIDIALDAHRFKRVSMMFWHSMFIVLVISAVSLSLVFFRRPVVFGQYVEHMPFVVLALFIMLGILVMFVLPRFNRCFVYGLALLLVINVTFEGWFTANGRYTIHRSQIDTVVEDTRTALRLLEERQGSNMYRVASLYNYFTGMSNNGLMLGYNGVFHYKSVPNRNLTQFYISLLPELILIHTGVMVLNIGGVLFNRYDIGALLNVRYVLCRGGSAFAIMPQYEFIDSVGDVNIYRNVLADGFGIKFENAISEEAFFMIDSLDARREVLRHSVVLSSGYEYSNGLLPNTQAYHWEGFGSHSVEFTRTRSSARLYGEVQNVNDSFLFLPIPYEIGWTARVNGYVVPFIRANLGFVALHLNEGKHIVELLYRSPGLLVGGGISFTSLMILCGFSSLIYLKRKKEDRG